MIVDKILDEVLDSGSIPDNSTISILIDILRNIYCVVDIILKFWYNNNTKTDKGEKNES